MATIWLETPRLVLRQITTEDADDLVALDADPEVVRFVGGRHTPIEEVRNRMLPAMMDWYVRAPDRGFWAAIAKDSGDFLGWFHYRAPHEPDVPGVELGYRLKRTAWGQGYATEVSRAIIAKGFSEPGVDRICAKTLSVNVASRRVMEKVGLTYERTFTETRIDPPAEAVWYGLDRVDYERLVKRL